MAVSGPYMLHLINHAYRLGVDRSVLMDLTGFTPEQLCQHETMVENDVHDIVFDRIISEVEDPYFGLRFGEQLNLSAAGIILQIAMNSETLKKALENACQLVSLTTTQFNMTAGERDVHFELTISINEQWLANRPQIAQYSLDVLLVFIQKEFEALTFGSRSPVKIEYQFECTSDQAMYEDMLKCPVHFGSACTKVIYKNEDVDQQIVGADFELLGMLVTHANKKLDHLETKSSFKGVVRDSVLLLTQPNFPTIDQVSRNLGLSRRTLQRKLSEEHTSFKQLIDEIRKEFALDHLKNPDLTIAQVAYLSGYGDSSTFIRSFKRWVGKTPQEYRLTIKS